MIKCILSKKVFCCYGNETWSVKCPRIIFGGGSKAQIKFFFKIMSVPNFMPPDIIAQYLHDLTLIISSNCTFVHRRGSIYIWEIIFRFRQLKINRIFFKFIFISRRDSAYVLKIIFIYIKLKSSKWLFNGVCQ